MAFNDGLFNDGFTPPPTFVPASGTLGRFQLGDTVPLLVQTYDGSGNLTTPDAAPVATIKDGNGDTIATLKLAMQGVSTAFGLQIFLGLSFTVGTYSVTYSYTIAGNAGTASATFVIIPGGDVGGSIISMYAYDRPEALYVVAQLTSGNIVQGRNPSLL